MRKYKEEGYQYKTIIYINSKWKIRVLISVSDMSNTVIVDILPYNLIHQISQHYTPSNTLLDSPSLSTNGVAF